MSIYEELTEKDIERFWSKVDKKSDDECWIWMGYKKEGYGYFDFNKTSVSAHHVSYYIKYGNLDNNIYFSHICGKKDCCNPNHLLIKKKWFDIPIDDKNFVEAFWKLVDIKEGDSCWKWLGSKAKGYGVIGYKGRAYRAHRISYAIHNNMRHIPAGMMACHICDCRECVRPDHLFLGTDADNNKDKENKNRGNHPVGENNGMAKVTEDDVLKIRKLYANKEMTQVQLGKKFGLRDGTIGRIVKGENWKNVGGEITILESRRDAIAKLNKDEVREIKILLKKGLLYQREIASMFNVDARTISAINCNKIWKDIII
jgi:DNA-binding XRE family transcriptional regulator